MRIAVSGSTTMVAAAAMSAMETPTSNGAQRRRPGQTSATVSTKSAATKKTATATSAMARFRASSARAGVGERLSSVSRASAARCAAIERWTSNRSLPSAS